MRSRLTYFMALALLKVGTAGQAQDREARPAPVLIESIQAAAQGAETRVTVLLRGRAEPRLAVMDKNVTLRLAAARPGERLASHMTSGGIVRRIGFQSGSRAGESLVDEGQVTLELSASADASIIASTDPQVVTVRLVARGAAAAAPITRSEESRLFDIAAYQTDVSLLLRSLAQEANCNILLSDKVSSKVTINLHQVELAKAIDLITRSAGLTVKRDGDTYLVSPQEESRVHPGVALPAVPAGGLTPKRTEPAQGVYEVVHCHYILAADLAATLSKMFLPEELKVSLGAATFAPRLENGNSTSGVTGLDGAASKGQDKSEAGSGAHDVVLYGAPETVARAIYTARYITEPKFDQVLAIHAGISFEQLVAWMVEDASLDR